MGKGFVLFYAPIFFVERLDLSPVQVAIGLGSTVAISGILGRFLGGIFTDSPVWGRRRTLLLSAAISAFADLILVLSSNFPIFMIGNLLMGLGIGLYWPATEAAVVDLTTREQRNEAFAITILADSIGLGLGVILGGVWIARSGNYRALFIIDGISFVLFFVLIYVAIAETYQFDKEDSRQKSLQGWLTPLKDRCLLIFLPVNILFTSYIAQVETTMPLYFKKFVAVGMGERGFSASTIAMIFSWYVVCTAISQLPMARFLNRFSRPRALRLSLLCWGIGFILIVVTGIVEVYSGVWAILALGILAIAKVSYTPSAPGLVADLAPPQLRGLYISFNSQCWAIGFLIGPPIGGWALERSTYIAHNFWLVVAASVAFGIIILQYLDRILSRRHL